MWSNGSGTPPVLNIGSIKMSDIDYRVRELEIEMSQHEAQCEERWKTTFNRLQDIEDGLNRMENRLLMGAGSMILFLSGVIVTLLMK